MSSPQSAATRLYQIFVIILITIIFATLIANTVYFRRIYNQGGVPGLNQSSASWLFWINLFMTIAAGVIFVWSLTRYFVHASAINAATAYLRAQPTGIVAYDPRVGLATNLGVSSNPQVFQGSGGIIRFDPAGQPIVTPAMPIAGTLSAVSIE